MPDDFDADRARRLRRLADARIEALADEVVAFLKGEPSRLAPEDLKLASAWEEYAIQVAGEESIDFEIYCDIVRDVASGIASAARRTEQELCVLYSERYIDWWYDQEGDPSKAPLPASIHEWLIDDIIRAVNLRAEQDGDEINERINSGRCVQDEGHEDNEDDDNESKEAELK